MTGCSNPLASLLTGGGPKIAANVQAGKTNTQTVGTTNVVEQKLENLQADRVRQSSDNNKVQSESVDSVTINEVNPWVLLLLVLGWLLPSPNEIGRTVRGWFSKSKN